MIKIKQVEKNNDVNYKLQTNVKNEKLDYLKNCRI